MPFRTSDFDIGIDIDLILASVHFARQHKLEQIPSFTEAENHLESLIIEDESHSSADSVFLLLFGELESLNMLTLHSV